MGFYFLSLVFVSVRMVDMVSMVLMGFLYPALVWKVLPEASNVVHKNFCEWWRTVLSSLSRLAHPREFKVNH